MIDLNNAMENTAANLSNKMEQNSELMNRTKYEVDTALRNTESQMQFIVVAATEQIYTVQRNVRYKYRIIIILFILLLRIIYIR